MSVLTERQERRGLVLSAGSVIAIGFGVWVLVMGLVVSLVRVAGRSESVAEPEPAEPQPPSPVDPGSAGIREADGLLEDGALRRRLRTLALEDPSAGRHAAAVARTSLALARSAGLPRREQDVAHAAGLLHDIGKAASLSAIPAAERELRRNDHRMIRRHPMDGARLVRKVPGLELVAEAVLSHHERVDGNGYPYGLRGRSIPPAARVVAVAEVYDVLTAPDSYRQPMTAEQALAELRRVAGTQLDPHLVEIFAGAMAARADAAAVRDADLETELRRRRTDGELLDAQRRARQFTPRSRRHLQRYEPPA